MRLGVRYLVGRVEQTREVKRTPWNKGVTGYKRTPYNKGKKWSAEQRKNFAKTMKKKWAERRVAKEKEA